MFSLISCRGFSYVTKSLYPSVAALHGTTVGCVERNMRTAVSVCWRRNRAYLEALAGYALEEKPGTADFVTIVVNHILRMRCAAQ